ncbi:hypothetical protein [Cysteiniphilum litorale]|uniref:hypothetical protein n=1 Tax=Cysteiniphilum litorale TaxID=2056700 RepID=UPI003F88232B
MFKQLRTDYLRELVAPWLEDPTKLYMLLVADFKKLYPILTREIMSLAYLGESEKVHTLILFHEYLDNDLPYMTNEPSKIIQKIYPPDTHKNEHDNLITKLIALKRYKLKSLHFNRLLFDHQCDKDFALVASVNGDYIYLVPKFKDDPDCISLNNLRDRSRDLNSFDNLCQNYHVGINNLKNHIKKVKHQLNTGISSSFRNRLINNLSESKSKLKTLRQTCIDDLNSRSDIDAYRPLLITGTSIPNTPIYVDAMTRLFELKTTPDIVKRTNEFKVIYFEVVNSRDFATLSNLRKSFIRWVKLCNRLLGINQVITSLQNCSGFESLIHLYECDADHRTITYTKPQINTAKLRHTIELILESPDFDADDIFCYLHLRK